MQFYKIILFMLFIIPSVYGPSSQAQSGTVVAQIGNEQEIHFSSLNTFYVNNQFGLKYPDSELKGYWEALDMIITNRLKQIDFFESDLHQDSAIVQDIQRMISEELVHKYFESEFLGKYLSEDSIREYHEGLGKKFTYRQIVLHNTPGMSTENRIKLEAKIEKILEAISENESFELLVNQYSQDTRSANRGGLAPPASYENESSRPFFHQIYMLDVGDVKVLETGTYYYIIKIEEIEEMEVKPLKEIRRKVVENLRNIYLNQSYREFEDEKDSLIDKDSYEWNQEALEQVVKWAEQNNFYSRHYKDTLNEAISRGDNDLLLTHAKGTVDLQEYLRLLNDVLIMQDLRNPTAESHKNFIDEAIRTDLLVKQAKEKNLERNIFHAGSSSNRLLNQAVRLYNEVMIDSKIPEPDQQDLQDFYEIHKDSLYYQLQRVRIYALVYDDSEKAEDAFIRHQEGTRFEDLESGYLVRTFQKNREGEIESYLRREEPFLGEAAFSLEEVDDVEGPVMFDHPENGRQYAIIKLSNRLEEKHLTYGEIEHRIERDFKEHHRNQIVDSLKKELWDKYPVTIYKDNLQRNIAEL